MFLLFVGCCYCNEKMYVRCIICYETKTICEVAENLKLSFQNLLLVDLTSTWTNYQTTVRATCYIQASSYSIGIYCCIIIITCGGLCWTLQMLRVVARKKRKTHDIGIFKLKDMRIYQNLFTFQFYYSVDETNHIASLTIEFVICKKQRTKKIAVL